MLGFALLGLRQGLDVVGIARKDVSAVSPFIHGLVVQVDVRLREEGDETVLDVQLHRRRPGIFAASGTPEVEASALIAELPDTPHDRGHGDPLCPDRTDEGVVDINENDLLLHGMPGNAWRELDEGSAPHIRARCIVEQWTQHPVELHLMEMLEHAGIGGVLPISSRVYRCTQMIR